MTTIRKFKFLSLVVCFLLLLSSNAYAMTDSTSPKLEKELKKLETKYGVTIDFKEAFSTKTKDKIQLKDIKEFEELLKDIAKGKENRKTKKIILPMQEPSINSPVQTLAVPIYDPSTGHYVSKDWAPYDSRLAGSALLWEYVEFDYELNSNGSIKDITWITSSVTGLSTASWEHLSGTKTYHTKNYYRDSATVYANGLWHLNFGIGSGSGLVSWRDTFKCEFISPFSHI